MQHQSQSSSLVDDWKNSPQTADHRRKALSFLSKEIPPTSHEMFQSMRVVEDQCFKTSQNKADYNQKIHNALSNLKQQQQAPPSQNQHQSHMLGNNQLSQTSQISNMPNSAGTGVIQQTQQNIIVTNTQPQTPQQQQQMQALNSQNQQFRPQIQNTNLIKKPMINQSQASTISTKPINSTQTQLNTTQLMNPSSSIQQPAQNVTNVASINPNQIIKNQSQLLSQNMPQQSNSLRQNSQTIFFTNQQVTSVSSNINSSTNTVNTSSSLPLNQPYSNNQLNGPTLVISQLQPNQQQMQQTIPIINNLNHSNSQPLQSNQMVNSQQSIHQNTINSLGNNINPNQIMNMSGNNSNINGGNVNTNLITASVSNVGSNNTNPIINQSVQSQIFNNQNQSQITSQQFPSNTAVSNLNSSQASNTMINEEEELYNRKIEELKQHLPRLERLLVNSAGRSSDANKLKAFIDVINGTKKVSMDLLIKCENSLISIQQKQPIQRQPTQQSQPLTIQQPIGGGIQVQNTTQQAQIQTNLPVQSNLINQSNTQNISQQNLNTNPYQQTIITQLKQQPQQQTQIQSQNLQQKLSTINSTQIQNQISTSLQQQTHQPQIHPQLSSQSVQQHHLSASPQILNQKQPQQQSQSLSISQASTQGSQSSLQSQTQSTSLASISSPQINPVIPQQTLHNNSQISQIKHHASDPQVLTQSSQQSALLQPIYKANSYQQISQAIDACNNSNPVHKSNARRLIESVQIAINGPPMKMMKIDLNFKFDSNFIHNSKRKKLTSLRGYLTQTKSPNNDNIPKLLLIELASLSNSKYKIEIKSKNQYLQLPFQEPINHVKYKQNENLNDPGTAHNIHIISNKINKSITSPLENDYVTLKCMINNQRLPLVPPIRIFVPYNYPEANPFVDCEQLDDFDDDMLPEYNTFTILRRINKLFQINYLHLPERYSATELLDAWYSSIENI